MYSLHLRWKLLQKNFRCLFPTCCLSPASPLLSLSAVCLSFFWRLSADSLCCLSAVSLSLSSFFLLTLCRLSLFPLFFCDYLLTLSACSVLALSAYFLSLSYLSLSYLFLPLPFFLSLLSLCCLSLRTDGCVLSLSPSSQLTHAHTHTRTCSKTLLVTYADCFLPPICRWALSPISHLVSHWHTHAHTHYSSLSTLSTHTRTDASVNRVQKSREKWSEVWGLTSRANNKNKKIEKVSKLTILNPPTSGKRAVLTTE